ncbi:MAG: glycosyltransferase family 2 protein [Lachnospiraceae bacterium]|nr:glycosyltransferase family 2 protein [Lachnospiraceae bacterium]
MIAVSVLITTYNLEQYIEKTLNSVLCQKTDFEYEILVGDDGSTDATLDIVEKVRNRSHINIEIYKMPRDYNKKYNPIYRASRNRLNLLKYAKGEFVTFLDGDDLYVSDVFLQTEFDILSHNKEYVMCGCDLILYDSDKAVQKRVNGECLSEGKISKRKYWSKYWVPAECFLYRNVYKKVKKIEMNHNVFDDNLIVFYFMKYGEIYYINRPMVAYRQNPTDWKKKSKLLQDLYSAMDIYEEIRINPKLRLQTVIRHFGQLCTLFENMSKLQADSFNRERYICKKNRYRVFYWLLCYEKIGIVEKVLLYIIRQGLYILSPIINVVMNFI